MRRRLGAWLRKHADRIDPRGAPRLTGMTFTYEEGVGMVIHHNYGRLATRDDGGLRYGPNGERSPGCRLAYLGMDDYERAHTDGTA